MAVRIPVVLAGGEFQQLQAADRLKFGTSSSDFRYTYSTATTSTNPGDGKLNFDQSSVSQFIGHLYISQQDLDGNDLSNYIPGWDNGTTSTPRGYLTIRGANPDAVAVFEITGTGLFRQSGDGDSSFDLGLTGPGPVIIYAIAVQEDGKIIIGGDFDTCLGVTRNNIARINADWTLDSGFDPNADASVRAIVVQPDGQVLVGGYFANIGGDARNGIARLDAITGLVDSFDAAANAFAQVVTIALQPDGQILVGGGFSSMGGASRQHIARLDGVTALADSFDPNPDGQVYTIVQQADGQILAGGAFAHIGGQTRNGIARLDLVTGLADSFNPNASSAVTSIALQDDGNIVVGGAFNGASSIGGETRNFIARLDPTTGLADSWDPDSNADISVVVVQPDGQILVGGGFTVIGGGGRGGLARLDATTGLLDSFDANVNDAVLAIGILPDDSIFVAGSFSNVGGLSRNGIAALLAVHTDIGLTALVIGAGAFANNDPVTVSVDLTAPVNSLVARTDTAQTLNGNQTFAGTIITRASTTSSGTAPIVFPFGALMTTPQVGAMEYRTSGLYFTPSSGVRQSFVLGPAIGSTGAGVITLTGPTANRTITVPDINCSLVALDQSNTFTGAFNAFTPIARSGVPALTSYHRVNVAPDTAISASTEAVGVTWGAGTRTWANGAFALQREHVMEAPTYAFASGSNLITTAINLDIADPVAGAFAAAFTNAYSLRAANVLFTGIIKAGSTPTTLTNAAGKLLSAALDFTGTAPQISLGANSGNIGSIKFFGNSTGDVTITPLAAAGTAIVITLPATTTTMAGLAVTQTFTQANTFTVSGSPQLILGASAATLGSIKFFGTGAGDCTLQPTATPGSSTVITMPATTTTLAGLAVIQTFSVRQTISTTGSSSGVFDVIKSSTTASSTVFGMTVKESTTPTYAGNADNLLTIRGTGSSTTVWRGRISAGGDNVAFLMGEYNSQAWLGAHNAAMAAWADLYINPDGGAAVYIGDIGGGVANAPVPVLSVTNANNGLVSIGTAPSVTSVRLNVLATFEQLRLSYDASNYFSTTVSSSGGVTLDAVGSGASFSFSDRIINTLPVRLKGYTVAGLPAGTQGDFAFATDLLTPTFLVTAVGSGAVVGPVFYNGTAWVTV